MKKFLAIMLAVSFIFTMFAMTSCGDEKDPADTKDTTPADTQGPDTQAPDTQAPETQAPETQAPETAEPTPSDEPNMYPYTGDVIPASVDYDWGAPDAVSQYFQIPEENIIHDGKGTWSNATNTIASAAFDLDYTTFYDCDEKLEYTNTDAEMIGIPGDGTFESCYVGAYFPDGINLTQIRFMPRGDQIARITGCYFEASTDSENWEQIYFIEELVNGGAEFEFIDFDGQTTWNYIRFVGRSHADYVDDYSYGNVGEIEFWGTPAK